MKLSDTACRNAKASDKLRKLSDGGGLQLWVQPTGAKLWRLAYRLHGKQRLLAIGTYPVISLVEARRIRENSKRDLAAGIDPSQRKRTEKLQLASGITTFQSVAEEYVAKQKREGRASNTIDKIEWLLSFAYPHIGRSTLKQISSADILTVLQKVEQRGRFDTARRLRSTIGRVFRFGIATARADNDPTVALQGALTAPVVKSRAAITDPKAFGGMLRAIDGFDGQPTTQAALKLMALLFPRPGELRLAEWSEFDFQKQIWTIPENRMKMRRPHRSPLSQQASNILQALHLITGGGKLVFPSVRSVQRPISENTLNAALRRLGYSKEEATAHGFRASASTLLNESGKWHYDAIERQLAHLDQNDVRRAYARGEHWDERVQMMQWWADHIDELKISNPNAKHL
ncbi:MAG: integrase arm-type DNA-binding domain-containing protein [Bradyrhizobium sp.]|nr:integrase arm-type DNA-binding domain-containing protein [Bradyrhizobium sp.]